MKRSPKLLILTLLLVVSLVLVACGGEDPAAEVEPEPTATEAPEEPTPSATPEPTIVDIAVADENFSTLVTALESAGLVETLQGEGPFTVFAPTNDAFAALPEGALEALLADPDALSEVLLYHVVAGEVYAADVVELSSATAVSGEMLEISTEDDSVMINDAQVVTVDIEASNGVIHVIDSVLLPPTVQADNEPGDIVTVAAEAGQFETLLAAAQAAGLAETLASEGPFTVFAPTDEAFAALGQDTIDSLLANPEQLSEILLYHVVEGAVYAEDVAAIDSATTVQGSDLTVSVSNGTVMVDDATVVATDVEASNGVIHVIDSVLLPPAAEAESQPDLVATAAAAGQFETLLAAAEAAGLVETLQGEGPFTVFAPTDEAFAALGQETIDSLLAQPELLAEILLYHVVPGKVMAADVIEVNGAITAAGAPIAITTMDDNVQVNDATVVATDVEAANGVIHVIDSVLLPPDGDIVDIVLADENFSTLAAAVDAAGLVEALRAEGPFTVFAPTDEAFAALPDGALDALLADPEALSNVILYHAVDGAVFAGDVVALESAATLNGDPLSISVDDAGNVFIDDAQVTVTDILASNGVIHVIDSVLLPPEG